ncbi:ribonuclease II, chloroplastic/mitochondrial isoform X5 [Beta vulgaris subsp. vulgaris]|uniref:ribonuclease II, chloroplastic/mitochondrial isoform X5 n=1 Tax=Beta vulgaris subsp. vulgaris TaxID=3555 RepID=UPI00203735DB|nr:ribonuclease II, chloroplastic/mitochondrial isoform X5 [Beta vulgaris subsp. vulgaris]
MMLGVRTVHSSCIIRSSANSSHSLSSFFCSFHQYRPTHSRTPSKLGFLPSKCRFELHFNGYGGKLGVSDGHSLVDSVLKELHERRRTMRVQFSNKCFPCRLESTSNGELLKDKLEKQELRGGLLLEFKKDTERVLLAVVQKPDGKKNWMVSDQNGTTCSIKPQQITYVVPGVENFEHTQIPEFIQKAQDNLDASLLELAWAELLEKNNSVTPKELAEIIYGTSEPLESYCAHLLLSKDEIYFSMMETKGYCSVYAPRPIDQVEELLRRRLAKETAEKELQEFIQLLSSAKARPMDAKLSRSSWILEERIRDCVEALAAYAVDTCCTEIQKRTVGTILTAMGLAKSSSSAFNLLIDIGYFPVHVNLDLLKLNIRTNHSDDIVSAAEDLLSVSFDIDEIRRIDLTHLKVYAIDVDEADELDDALSAARLQDGRIKIWIHVADATCLVQPGSTLDNIAEYSVENTFIRPTYMLTYESASELLHLSLEEEAELKILSEAAALRLHWRRQQGAVDTSMIETRVKVENPDDPEPRINLYVENQADPAMRLVSEMMILCGEVIATFGSCNNINLPYRGQPQSNIDVSAFSHLPEGPARSCAIVKIMRAAEYDFRKPIRHGILGIPGYVQFTSPIRRYMDLLAHYQVKAFIRGDSPPFSAGQLEGIASIVNMQQRVARKLYNSSLRYWILEYLRRQPRERKFRALILRFIKDRIAALILVEVGLQASAWVTVGSQVGDEIEVRVEDAHPRADNLSLKQVAQ